jgi:glucokinase-like ROK family protein
MVDPKVTTGDVQLVRRLNRDAVLGLIRERGPISRTALARLAHLTPATVFSIVDELTQQGLAQPRGIGPSQGGRRPMLFEFAAQAYAAIGVDIRSSEVTGVLATLDGVPCRTTTRSYLPQTGIDVVPLAVDVIQELITTSPIPPDRLAGVGLAVPGLVNIEQGVVVESVNWGWHDLPLRDQLSERIHLPIYLEEDDNALAIGEGFFGAGRGTPNFVCLKVGRGLGAGIIIGGSLIRGPDNSAGEINHILVDPEGPQCYCGNYGCLGRMVSAAAISERAVKELKQGAASSLLATVQGDLEQITVALIAEAANAGDPFACQMMEQTGRYLGIGVATLVNLLNPDLVIIGGGVILAGAPLLDPIRRVVKLRTTAAAGQRAQIVPAQLGMAAPAIGAAALVMIQQGLLPTNALPIA